MGAVRSFSWTNGKDFPGDRLVQFCNDSHPSSLLWPVFTAEWLTNEAKRLLWSAWEGRLSSLHDKVRSDFCGGKCHPAHHLQLSAAEVNFNNSSAVEDKKSESQENLHISIGDMLSTIHGVRDSERRGYIQPGTGTKRKKYCPKCGQKKN